MSLLHNKIIIMPTSHITATIVNVGRVATTAAAAEKTATALHCSNVLLTSEEGLKSKYIKILYHHHSSFKGLLFFFF